MKHLFSCICKWPQSWLMEGEKMIAQTIDLHKTETTVFLPQLMPYHSPNYTEEMCNFTGLTTESKNSWVGRLTDTLYKLNSLTGCVSSCKMAELKTFVCKCITSFQLIWRLTEPSKLFVTVSYLPVSWYLAVSVNTQTKAAPILPSQRTTAN